MSQGPKDDACQDAFTYQGQGHSDLKILRDTLLSQYASTHQT